MKNVIINLNPILQSGYWGENIEAKLEGTVLTLTSEIKGSGISERASAAHMKEISKLVITGKIKYIDDNVFSEIQSLELVHIDSEYFESIGYKAFENCKHLQRVILNDCRYLREIGADAFWGCRSLKYINLPKNLKNIMGGCFLIL